MIVNSIGSIVLYFTISIGLAWPIAMRIAASPSERLLATVSLSLLGVYLLAWAVYVWVLPLEVLWALPFAAIILLLARWRTLVATWHDREARDLIVAQVSVTGWCVCWLALVVTYSGGGWVADWFGHWQRAIFFLERGPQDILFNGFDPLTSRPPLVNIVVGAFMALTQTDFAHYQLAMTFFGSLAFLPAALITRRLGAQRGVTLLAVLFMVNPMFVQNTTFAWTKLPAAFFALGAVYYFLQRERGIPHAGIVCASMTGASLLAHYSAGPYAVVLAVAWLIRGWPSLLRGQWWRETTMSGLVGFAILLTWFAWAFRQYGIAGTLLTNTTVTSGSTTIGAQLTSIALNIRDTFVPHFLRYVDYGFISQSSPWGWWRDWFFQLYQLNLFLAFGSIAWLATIVTLMKNPGVVTLKARLATLVAAVGVALLGIAVHSGRDIWGLAHICLQPLVLAGLAFLAANWDSIGQTWRRFVVAGAAVDFMLGIVLQFGAQSLLLDRLFAPARPDSEALRSYSAAAGINLNAKAYFKLTFFGDNYASHHLVILCLLAALLFCAVFRASRHAVMRTACDHTRPDSSLSRD